MRTSFSYLGLAVIILFSFFQQQVDAADIEYAVVAFPQQNQQVSVHVGGQAYPLTPSTEHPNLFKGIAPAGDQYQYALGDLIETNLRQQQQGITTTGNDFFNRTRTVYDVPALPQAYNPLYSPLMTNMNRSDEIATIILNANVTGFNEILTNPLGDISYIKVFNMTYIVNKEIFSFSTAGIKNSGQSTKEFAKQSYKIKLNKFSNSGDGDKEELLYGRSVLKLRAHETDPTFVREKLLMDCLAASGAVTLSGSYVRLYVNNEPFGLYLMIDDGTTNFINAAMRGGNQKFEYTGPTYKGNAISPELEGNLVYNGDLQESYNDTIYKLEDAGNRKKYMNATNEKTPLIDFTRELSLIVPATITDNANNLEKLANSQQTMIHLAMSYLSGSWDGVWYQASNYYLTQDTSNNQWALISYDFDESFGSGAPDYMATTPYSNFSRPGSKRPLVEAFINSPYYKNEFEKVLQTLVKRFFKASVINPRLDAWTQMLREDVEWDLSIEPKSPGIKSTWTLWNFDTNMKMKDGLNMGVAEWVETRSTSLQQLLNFNDVDDLPVTGPYQPQSIWDPNNYNDDDAKIVSSDDKQTGAANKKISMSTTITTGIIVALCLVGQFFL